MVVMFKNTMGQKNTELPLTSVRVLWESLCLVLGKDPCMAGAFGRVPQRAGLALGPCSLMEARSLTIHTHAQRHALDSHFTSHATGRKFQESYENKKDWRNACWLPAHPQDT